MSPRRLPRLRIAWTILIACVSPSLVTAGGSAWTPAVRERMAADALKVAPPTLARFILRHLDTFRAGMRDAASKGEAGGHAQRGEETSGAAAALETTERWAAAAMEKRRPLQVLVYRLGVVAHYAADLHDPFLTSPAGAGAPFSSDYALYVERNLHLYPVVFYGYPPVTGIPGAEEAGAFARAEALAGASRARDYFPHLERAYAASGGSSASFDVRSIPFGIASLAYSRAVTGIARSWLRVWAVSRGDLSGTPHLEGAPPVPAGMRLEVKRTESAISRVRDAATPPPPPGGGAGGVAAQDPDSPPAFTKTIYGKSRRERAKREDDVQED